MGSTFGKVRKYNLNPVPESAPPNKYSSMDTLGERGSSPMPPPLPKDNKDIQSHPHRPTPRERAHEKYPRAEKPTDQRDLFIIGYPPYIAPEYYGFHVDEDMLIPEEYAHYYVKTGNQPREYRSPDRGKRPPTPPSNTPLQAPPLPPRNSKPFGPTSLKPDTASDPNPRPPQKFYSSEDINKLLTPLNTQNRATLHPPTQSHHTQPRSESVPLQAYHTIGPRSKYYTNGCKCNHPRRPALNYNEMKWDHRPPPPYNHAGSSYVYENRLVQEKTAGPSVHQSSIYHEVPKSQYKFNESANSRVVEPPSQIKYNTISADKNIYYHHRHDLNASTIPRTPTSPKYIYQPYVHGYRVSHPVQQYVVVQPHQHPSTNHITKTNEKDVDSRTHEKQQVRQNQDTFYRTGLMSQPELYDIPIYASNPSCHHCYTIPEEGTWPPPFHHSQAFQSSHPKSHHQ